jgi:hypothetical protein
MMKDLQQRRDELKLQLHLASKEAEDEWEELMSEWDKFLSRSQFDKSAEEVDDLRTVCTIAVARRDWISFDRTVVI